MVISPERERLYSDLEAKIGNTPLERFPEAVPNNNTILLKREDENPFGSHYDRVYLNLFRLREAAGIIALGSRVIETTSGSAGISFASIGLLLGYECFVALPADGEKARERAILEQLPDEKHLIFTDAASYVSGFPKFLRTYLSEHPDVHFLNHSMGPFEKQSGRYANNEATLQALEAIANEALKQVHRHIDYFVPAVGNGSSLLGPARAFRRQVPALKVVGFETFQSAVAYDLLYPGEYKKRFGIEPGTLSRHRLPGTSFPGIQFPHILNAVKGNFIDDVVLVSDQAMDEEYLRLTGSTDSSGLPHWDVPIPGYEHLGRSTRAGIAVALDIAKRVNDKNLLAIAYDKAERYDS